MLKQTYEDDGTHPDEHKMQRNTGSQVTFKK